MRRRENPSRRMRRIRVLGNELPAFPVISNVTPMLVLHTARYICIPPGGLSSRRRCRHNPVRSRHRPPMPGADLTMKDQVGGNQGSARIQALFQSLRPDLLRFAFWLCRDRALAEDVVQESMLRA